MTQVLSKRERNAISALQSAHEVLLGIYSAESAINLKIANALNAYEPQYTMPAWEEFSPNSDWISEREYNLRRDATAIKKEEQEPTPPPSNPIAHHEKIR